jgi:hypothetical protein
MVILLLISNGIPLRPMLTPASVLMAARQALAQGAPDPVYRPASARSE